MYLFLTGQSHEAVARLAANLSAHEEIYVSSAVDLAATARMLDTLYLPHAQALEMLSRRRRGSAALSFQDWLDPEGVVPAEAFPAAARLPIGGGGPDASMIHRLAPQCPAAPLPIRDLAGDDAMLDLFIALSGWKTLKRLGGACALRLSRSSYVEELIDRFPSLQIIYLVSDPVDGVRTRAQALAAMRHRGEAGPTAEDVLVAAGEYLVDSEEALALKRRLGDAVLLTSVAALQDRTRQPSAEREIADYLQIEFAADARPLAWPSLRLEPLTSFVRTTMRNALGAFPETCDGEAEAFLASLSNVAMPNPTGAALPLTEHGGVLVSARGLAVPEAEGCWTSSRTIDLRWRVEGAPCSGVSLKLRPRRSHSGEPIRCAFSFGGASISRSLAQNASWSEVYAVELTAKTPVSVGEIARLSITVDNPKQMNEPPTDDRRALGLFILSATPMEAD